MKLFVIIALVYSVAIYFLTRILCLFVGKCIVKKHFKSRTDNELLDAAYLDGASSKQMYIHFVKPVINPAVRLVSFGSAVASLNGLLIAKYRPFDAIIGKDIKIRALSTDLFNLNFDTALDFIGWVIDGIAVIIPVIIVLLIFVKLLLKLYVKYTA